MMETLDISKHPFQSIPADWDSREELRKKGQFWTPPWLAKIMAAWLIENRPASLFDPAVGPGTFFSAARTMGFNGWFDGFELHEAAFADGEKLGLTGKDFSRIEIADFISSHFPGRFQP
jgi:adenine-specific DNA-methyltransferase